MVCLVCKWVSARCWANMHLSEAADLRMLCGCGEMANGGVRTNNNLDTPHNGVRIPTASFQRQTDRKLALTFLMFLA